VAERVLAGIEIKEQNGAEHAIPRAPTGIVAFVGRTLKGPIGEPATVQSFADYQRIFGGLWQPSTVSYAVEQFFENGGRTAIIVRVVNGGRAPTITLPAGAASLVLTGIAPGSREHLRASVDYDGIGSNETDRFNLVLQRLRGAGSELIEDQEIYRRVSIRPDAGRYIVDALLESRLVRVAGPIPLERPDPSPPAVPGGAVGYTNANNDGDDGVPLTDYDIIGSAQAGTGLFALKSVPIFNMLSIPPLGREQDVGASSLLVASRFCRERHALLLVDPPQSWSTPTSAIDALRDWPFRADNAVMHYPRIVAQDRLRGRPETFAPGGAVAGMLARLDETAPPWSPVEHDEVLLRPGLRPAVAVNDNERARLAQAGVNTLAAMRVAHRVPMSARTLATGNSGATDWRYLGPRRLAQFIALSVEQGTRWMMFRRSNPDSWLRARAQVEAFLESLDQEGAFPSSAAGEGYFVVCDERFNDRQAQAEGRVSLVYGFAATRPGEYHSFLVTHARGESRVRAVAVNRYTTSGRRVGEEIETGLLRGLQLP
jgi:phage tail sheath protein FI